MPYVPDPEEMRELVRCVAAHAHDLGFLHLGDLEAVAVGLHIHPFVVAAAKERLEDPVERARFLEEVRQARRELECVAPPCPAPRPARSSAPPACACELIRAAAQHPYGTAFLVHGYPEAVAVVFGVHPALVFRARDIWERWQRRHPDPEGTGGNRSTHASPEDASAPPRARHDDGTTHETTA